MVSEKSKQIAFKLFIAAFVTLQGCALEQTIDDSDEHSDYYDALDPKLLTPYANQGLYSQVLIDCAMAKNEEESCTLDTLPLIGMKTDKPSIEMILDRLIISKNHPWLAVGFERYLRQSPTEIIEMFSSVTAVVVADKINPSHYAVSSGAIFLVPELFTQQESEKTVLQKTADSRVVYREQLSFSQNAIVTFDNWDSLNLEGRNHLLISNLIFHELFHAIDIFNVSTIATVKSDETLYSQRVAILDNQASISQELTRESPLTSMLWKDFAQVLWGQIEPTIEQIKAQPIDIALMFELGAAASPYSYYSDQEDSANLFEVAMMKMVFDSDRIINFYDQRPESPCFEKMIHGSRGRLGESRVMKRAQLVVDKVFPSTELGNLDSAMVLEPDCIENMPSL